MHPRPCEEHTIVMGNYTVTHERDESDGGNDRVRVRSGDDFVLMTEDKKSVAGYFQFYWEPDPALSRQQLLEILVSDAAALERDFDRYIRSMREPPRTPFQPETYMLWTAEKGHSERLPLEAALAQPSIITGHDAFEHFHELGANTGAAVAKYTTSGGLLLGDLGLGMEAAEGKGLWTIEEGLVVVETIFEDMIGPWILHFASHTSKYKDLSQVLQMPQPLIGGGLPGALPSAQER